MLEYKIFHALVLSRSDLDKWTKMNTENGNVKKTNMILSPELYV